MSTLGPVIYYTLLIVPYLACFVLLWLQVRAYRRHRHRSFLLLSVGSVSGFLALVTRQTYGWLTLSMAWYLAGPVLWLLSVSVGIWGTVALFQSYDEIAASASKTEVARLTQKDL
jgi:hypothetical protein